MHIHSRVCMRSSHLCNPCCAVLLLPPAAAAWRLVSCCAGVGLLLHGRGQSHSLVAGDPRAAASLVESRPRASCACTARLSDGLIRSSTRCDWERNDGAGRWMMAAHGGAAGQFSRLVADRFPRRRICVAAAAVCAQANCGTMWKCNPFGGSSHAKGIVVEKVSADTTHRRRRTSEFDPHAPPTPFPSLTQRIRCSARARDGRGDSASTAERRAKWRRRRGWRCLCGGGMRTRGLLGCQSIPHSRSLPLSGARPFRSASRPASRPACDRSIA